MAELPAVWSQPPVRNLSPVYPSIEIAKIRPSRYQARKRFGEESLNALAESIRQEGLIEPIVVRFMGDHYELVSGERRLRACKLLGDSTIEAKVIQPVSEAEAAAKGLVENVQREDLNPVEEAEGYLEINRLDPGYWTHDQIAKVVGRSRSYITQSLAILKLPNVILDNVRALTLSRSHALELARLHTEVEQFSALSHVLDEKLSWEATRTLVDQLLNGSRIPKRRRANAKAPTQPAGSVASDPLADIWPVVKPAAGLKAVEYRDDLTWRFDVMPNGANLAKSDPAALRKELQFKLADALIATGQILRQSALPNP